MRERNNVLPRAPRPTKKSYRAALKQIVLDIQAEEGLNDAELAERLSCSAPTIANVRKELNNLDGVTLANIEYEFGPGAIDPFMSLGRSRAVPTGAVCSTDIDPCLTLTDALRVILMMRDPRSLGGVEELPEEIEPNLPTLRAARSVLDSLIERAAELRSHKGDAA